MPRRTMWFATGIVAGAASSLYAEHKLRRTLDAASARLQPDALVTEVGRSARQAARGTGARLRAAVATGRVEMQRREQELWADLSASDATDPSASVADGRDGSAAPGHADAPDPVTVPKAPAHLSRVRGRRRARRSPSHLGK